MMINEGNDYGDWFHLELLLVQLQGSMMMGDYLQAIEYATTIIGDMGLMEDDLNSLEYNHPDRHLVMEAYRSRGIAHKQIGDIYNAIIDLEKSIKLHGDPEIRNILAMLYFQQMETSLAYEHIQAVIGAAPHNLSYQINAGVIYMACDEMQQALACFNEVIASQMTQVGDYVGRCLDLSILHLPGDG